MKSDGFLSRSFRYTARFRVIPFVHENDSRNTQFCGISSFREIMGVVSFQFRVICSERNSFRNPNMIHDSLFLHCYMK
jgi:hypothetical protein